MAKKHCKVIFVYHMILCILALMLIGIMEGSVSVYGADRHDSITPKKLELGIGTSKKIEVNIKTDQAKYQWKSSDTKIAKVTKNGTVTALTKGKATITCKITSKKRTDTYKTLVVVYNPQFVQDTYNVNLGDKASIQIDYNVKGGTYQWKSSNPKIATVTSKGKIQTKKAGKTVVTCTVKWNKNKIILTTTVIVNKAKLINENILLTKGNSDSLTLVNIPSKASIQYSSNHTNIVSVDKAGTIKGISEGKAKITCVITKENVKILCFCYVTVNKITPTPTVRPTLTVTPVLSIPTPVPNPNIPSDPNIPLEPSAPTQIPTPTPKVTVTPTPAKDNPSGTNVKNYSYDKLGRLIKVEYSNGTVVIYQYDANGNITSITITDK